MAVEAQGPALAVSFGFEPGAWDEPTSQAVAEKLFELAGRLDGRTLLLSLAEVTYLSSGLLGKLVALHKRLRAHGGRLVLCDLRPAVRECLSRTRLEKFFDIRAPESLDSLVGSGPAG